MIAERLRQARLAAGMTQDEAVARLEGQITKAALSNYENSKRTPHAAMLRELGAAYGVRPQWFVREAPVELEWHAFRAAAALGQRDRAAIKAAVARDVEAFLEVAHLFPAALEADFPKRKKAETLEEADRLAADLRRRWALGQDAVESVAQNLEDHGAIIIHSEIAARRGFDGLSATADARHPVLAINRHAAADRLRFDLLHELGHVLMDSTALRDSQQEERLAHRFAASFLVPPPVVTKELGPKRKSLTLSELLVLKEKYGMSVGAWLMAAKAHGIISPALSSSLWRQMSSRGWRKREPDVFRGNEQPTKLRQYTLRAVAEGLIGAGRAIELVPELREQLEVEGLLHDPPAAASAKMSKAERGRRMRQAAEQAAAEYEQGALAEAREFEGGDIYEYE